MKRRVAGSGLAAVVALGLTASCAEPSAWREGEQRADWVLVYTGHGSVEQQDGTFSLTPRAATEADTTHAALVRSADTHERVRVSARMRTVSQLRTESPNPWETAWLMWAFTDGTHYYAFVLKPNGWELSKGDPAYPGAQRFLRSGPEVHDPFSWHTVTVEHDEDHMQVAVDGRVLTTFTDTERPYRSGAVALYTEDADVLFTDVRVEALTG